MCRSEFNPGNPLEGELQALESQNRFYYFCPEIREAANFGRKTGKLEQGNYHAFYRRDRKTVIMSWEKINVCFHFFLIAALENFAATSGKQKVSVQFWLVLYSIYKGSITASAALYSAAASRCKG